MKKLSKTNVKNMKKGVVAVALVASLGLAGLSAYFTDTQTKTNTFTVGSVKQELTEPSWKPEEKPGENMTPGKTVAKDPTVKNIGNNDQYVFMKVEVPAAEVTTFDENGNKVAQENQELFTYNINEGWTELVPEKKVTNTSVTHVYYYGTSESLTKLEKTKKATLFNSVTFKNIVEDTEDDPALKGDKKIVINSYGIQSDNLGTATTPEQVWTLVQNQAK